MLVTTASLVVRKERIWQRRESGRLLILSTPVGFEFELAIQSYFVVEQKLGNNGVWSSNLKILCQTNLVEKQVTA